MESRPVLGWKQNSLKRSRWISACLQAPKWKVCFMRYLRNSSLPGGLHNDLERYFLRGLCGSCCVIPFGLFIFDNFRLLQGNVTSVTEYLNEVGIHVLPWPARSSNLNPIEHIWDNHKGRVRAKVQALPTLKRLKTAVVEEWYNIPQLNIQHIVKGLRNRLQNVIRAFGFSFLTETRSPLY